MKCCECENYLPLEPVTGLGMCALIKNGVDDPFVYAVESSCMFVPDVCVNINMEKDHETNSSRDSE